jgi:ADP-ribose pyrophosphatase YjhB (NUDIX family)
MHRRRLLKLLEDYQPEDIQQAWAQSEISRFVTENKNCFERALEIGHVTASGWLLNCAGSHALLMHHVKMNRWIQPGGHCDGDPDVLAVALKEAREESGIKKVMCVSPHIFDLDVHSIPALGNIKEHFHYDVRFLLQAVGCDALAQNEESKGLMWVGKGDPLPTDEYSVVRLFKKWP